MPSTEILRARRLRETSGWAERLMWKWLRDRRFSGYKFRRQHPAGPYTLDFFREDAQLSIELDGGQHGLPENQAHDQLRTH
jgi:very-short-patch-repair endonuclease